ADQCRDEPAADRAGDASGAACQPLSGSGADQSRDSEGRDVPDVDGWTRRLARVDARDELGDVDREERCAMTRVKDMPCSLEGARSRVRLQLGCSSPWEAPPVRPR